MSAGSTAETACTKPGPNATPRAMSIRPAIFNLYAVALETADSDCLRLGEALASAADRLEDTAPSPRLIAALSSAIECLREPAGLESDAFGERARHFAARLESTAATIDATERSAVLDQLSSMKRMNNSICCMMR